MLDVVRRHPEFRKLWLAQSVSQFGNWLNRIAILTLISRLGGEKAGIGLGALYAIELSVRLLPATLVGPIAGPIADRLSRRHLMMASDILRSLVVLGMLFVREPAHLPWLYLLLMAQMSLSVFFESARSASVPNTVPKEDLHTAYALSAATWSTMLTLGTLSSALLLKVLGVEGLFILDAMTYLVSLGLLMTLRLPPMPVQSAPLEWRDIVFLRDMRRGWGHIRSQGLTAILMTKALWGPAGGFLVLLSLAGRAFAGAGGGGSAGEPIEAGDVAVAGGFATGILLAGRGLGTGLGPILTRARFGSSDAALRRAIQLGFVVAGLGYIVFPLVETLPAAALWVAIAHMGGSTIWVSSTTYWQKHVEDAYRGRVFALEFLTMTLAFTGGAWVAGIAYDRSGSIPITTWVICALVLISGAVWSWISRHSASEPVVEATVEELP